MIVLRSPELLVRLDPRHGGEILDLVDLRSGRQLLGRAPFGSEEPREGDLDEATWTRSYRGGWQLVLPNAGAECVVGGEQHGFHGRASNDPWEVEEATDAYAMLRWRGHGLEVERRLKVETTALAVSVETRALERAPLVALEHVSFGLEVTEPEVEIELPAGLAYELSETDGPAVPPADATRWPEVRLLDGSVERADRWRLARERGRFLVVTDVPEGRASVRNTHREAGLELSWDTEWLRHVWIWHEVRTYEGPWRKQAEVLVVEPTSVPHALGLAAAAELGQARWLDPGETAGYRLTARLLP